MCAGAASVRWRFVPAVASSILDLVWLERGSFIFIFSEEKNIFLIIIIMQPASCSAASRGVFLLCLVLLLCHLVWFEFIRPCRALATCLAATTSTAEGQRLGAYYQTSTSNPYATQLVLALFRQAYATALIVVYIDNDDGSRVVNWDAFQPIKVLPYNASARSADTRGMHFGTVDSCAAYVYRLIEAARRDDLDWLILLEDDVWVCSRIDTARLTHDMNGQCIAKYGEVWGSLAPGSCYGGYGGFVLRASFLRSIMPVNTSYIHEILTTIGRPVASDELLSALFLRSNGTIGRISDYAEEMTSTPVIVHQMKHFYHRRPDCDE